MLQVDLFGCTEKGPVRETNEDHILVGRFIKNRGRVYMRLDRDDDFMARYGLLAAVADGVGSQAGGALASRAALRTLDFEFHLRRKQAAAADEVLDVLRAAALKAHKLILKEAGLHPRYSQMCTTLTGLCLLSAGCLVFNAGDSRVYRFRNGFLKPVTKDHTVAAVNVRLPSHSNLHALAGSSTVTNCLGGASFKLTATEIPAVKAGDLFLVCSDGLYSLTPHAYLEHLIDPEADLDSIAAKLVQTALDYGGHDNISLILVRVGPDSPGAGAEK